MNNKLRLPELAQFIAFGYYIKIEETTWLEYPNPNYMRWVDSYDHTEYHTIPVIREEVKMGKMLLINPMWKSKDNILWIRLGPFLPKWPIKNYDGLIKMLCDHLSFYDRSFTRAETQKFKRCRDAWPSVADIQTQKCLKISNISGNFCILFNLIL